MGAWWSECSTSLVPTSPPTQDSWAKAAVPVATFVLRMRHKAVDMIKNMEAVDKVTAGTFRVLEHVVVTDDYKSIIAEMDPGLGRPTSARLRAVTHEILKARHWQWVIMHPGLDSQYIHPTRSVLHPPV